MGSFDGGYQGTPARRPFVLPPSLAVAQRAAELATVQTGVYLLPSFSFAITSSKLKLAAFCRCGYSLNVIRNWPT